MVASEMTLAYWNGDTSEATMETTIGQLLRQAAADNADAVALVEGVPDAASRRRLTYRELLERSEQMAQALLGRFHPGERVAIWSGNSVEWQISQYAAALAGLVLVTVNPAYRPRELAYVLTQSRSAGILLADEHRGSSLIETLHVAGPLPGLRQIVRLSELGEVVAARDESIALPDVNPADPVMIQYTSGTTGPPKGAMLSHRGVCNTSRMIGIRAGDTAGKVWLNPLPLFHVGSCVWSSLGTLWRGATHVLVPSPTAELLLQLIEEERATETTSVPTILISMLEDKRLTARDLSSLQLVITGGTTVPADLMRRIEKDLGAVFGVVFGQTEVSGVCTMTSPGDSFEDKATTVGTALPGTDLRIVDPETSRTALVGQAGEICVRGFGRMQSYFDLPEATAGTIDADGWLHTGDLGRMDERGYLKVTGRLKDMIIRGGENIYPREIEDCLFVHPGVMDVAVVGVPDDKWGEQVAAFVKVRPSSPPTIEELTEFVREHLSSHKRPRHWIFVDDFPLTPSGKIKKFELRQQFAKSRESGVSL
jgi:fatty-acyl-CoA synthase